MKISELQLKDVINVVDGSKIGYVLDVELDVRAGKIDALLIPISRGMFSWFRKTDDYFSIPWGDIVKIGTDVILVRLPDHTM